MSDGGQTGFIDFQEAVAGRYSLDEELGRGGMGIVYLAREVSLDRPVALKLLPLELAAQPTARERFLMEARTAAKLSHPNIVPIFAVDEVDEYVFFAMAYIDGETLGQRIRSRGPRPPSEVTRILREVAWALGYAHNQGVVHRDVKPDNIMLEAGSERALVMDFGIASAVERSTATEGRSVSGTAEFMSPEQAKGEPVGPASDLYSLGAVGFYALTGRFPFEGSTPAAIIAKHITEPAPPVASLAPAIPSRLAQAIDRCLTKDPCRRFGSNDALVAELSQSLPVRREVPAALRVFAKRESQIGVGGALLYIWVLSTFAAAFSRALPPHLTAVGISVIVAGGLIAVPGGIALGRVLGRARKLLKSGFGQEEVILALEAELGRTQEEKAYEFGQRPSLYERAVRLLSAGGLGVAALSGLALAVDLGVNPQALSAILAVSVTTGLGAGTLALVRLQLRRDIGGELRSWFWRSRLGRLVFKVAGVGLKRVPAAASGTYRPTELAIGLAADRLFEELPREMRRALSELPDVVRKLENDAQRMRVRVAELNDALAGVRAMPIASRSLESSPIPEDAERMSVERGRLEDDILRARDATQQHLAEAVAALETIRLGLLRMQAGSGSVESLTGDLVAARDVAGDIDRLLDAQRQVEGLLRESSIAQRSHGSLSSADRKRS
ncbi:MAG: serine/threonine protein kinase [Gemmatimonadota bacterium]|nr:MAG: serine/threonine protein kinase [Gemmatimonadota bacterium]